MKISDTMYRNGLAAALALAVVAPAGAQMEAPEEGVTTVEEIVEHGGWEGDEVRSLALPKGRYAVVIDLDDNLLHFRQGDVTLWSAPIGTGTGLTMHDGQADWDFSTPNGVFHVKYKERNPVWIAEDWYFIENGLPVPPRDDPRRFFPGGLGAAAVYFDYELAIHGTDKPELLGQRVSHGCIRLSNRDALRLYHNVQVGTEVVIVGGRDIPQEVITPAEARQLAEGFRPSEPRVAPRDPLLESWRAMSTRQLSMLLRSELWEHPQRSRWPEVAHLLSDRGLEGDEEALVGLLAGGLDVPSDHVELEFRTYLADAYARAGLTTLDALSRFDSGEREVLAAMIVDASLGLYHGDLTAPSAPWPTRRVPRLAVDESGVAGWLSLRDAEESFASREERRVTVR